MRRGGDKLGRPELMPRPGGSAARHGGTTLRDQERSAIIDAIRACDGNKTAAARRLKIAKSTLFQKLASYEIEPSEWR